MFKDKTKKLLQPGPLKSYGVWFARPDAQKCQMDIAANVAMLIVVNSIPVRPGGWALEDGLPGRITPMKWVRLPQGLLKGDLLAMVPIVFLEFMGSDGFR